MRVSVKLKHAPTRSWLATVTLRLSGARDVITVGFPEGAGGLAAWPDIRSVESSKAEVTQPALLLPPSAIADSGPDVAEALTLIVNGPDSAAPLRGPPMQVCRRRLRHITVHKFCICMANSCQCYHAASCACDPTPDRPSFVTTAAYVPGAWHQHQPLPPYSWQPLAAPTCSRGAVALSLGHLFSKLPFLSQWQLRS